MVISSFVVVVIMVYLIWRGGLRLGSIVSGGDNFGSGGDNYGSGLV